MKRKLCVVKEVIRKLKKMWDPSHAYEQELKLGKFKINFPCEKRSYLLYTTKLFQIWSLLYEKHLEFD